MTTNYHTAVALNADGLAAIFNAPLGELDSAIVYLLEILLLLEAALL